MCVCGALIFSFTPLWSDNIKNHKGVYVLLMLNHDPHQMSKIVSMAAGAKTRFRWHLI